MDHHCAAENCTAVPLYACGRCGRARYCGAPHQRDHWPVHKKECRKVKDTLPKPPQSAPQNRGPSPKTQPTQNSSTSQPAPRTGGSSSNKQPTHKSSSDGKDNSKVVVKQGGSEQKVVGEKVASTLDQRRAFKYNGHTIYEWEQDLEEVRLFITPPKGVPAKMMDIRFQPTHLYVGIKDPKIDVSKGEKRLQRYLDHELVDTADSEMSTWYMDDGELVICLHKTVIGQAWPGVFKGHLQLDSKQQQELQKSLILQRFQREHPSFDFSNANVNGAAPDPSKFLGGVNPNKLTMM